MSSPVKVLAPSGQVRAAEGLSDPRRRVGIFPYQWLFPGPNSKPVREAGAGELVSYGTAVPLIDFKVPTGMRFSLRGVVMDATTTGWVQGSGDLLFSLAVVGAGNRPVDYLGEVNTRLGSTFSPWPVLGRLEFQSGDRLVMTATPVATVGLGAGNLAVGMLVGHVYPNMEAGND